MSKPPHLAVFLTDNHNRNVLGSAGHPTVHTPALDTLAERGVRFSNAYCASPLCCPSQAALATGRFAHQSGYWDNALAYDGGLPTWHHRVREAQHRVSAIGKLYFRSGENDNGFSDEIDVMHIIEGKGALAGLLRATPQGVPRRRSHLAIYQDSVVGEADYLIYDRRITRQAIAWLHAHQHDREPWLLVVSYASPQPPFKVPQRFWDSYPLDEVPMPAAWRKADWPDHPADRYLAWMNRIEADFEETFVRRVIAGYCGLITHTDEQIGEVMAAMDALGLTDGTRIIYTSDHGEAACQHGILGKSNLYEHAVGVPLLMAGPDIPKGGTAATCVSHVDRFPTVVEAMGVAPHEQDAELPGESLWPLMDGTPRPRHGFAEFHANGSLNSSFMLRAGDYKLNYHVGMLRQLFHSSADPAQTDDLLKRGDGVAIADELERALRGMVEPEAADARSKADEAAHMVCFGGVDAVRKAGVFSRSPIPGKAVEMEAV